MRIENRCSKHLPVDINMLITQLLKHIPNSHLLDLEAIIIVDKFYEKNLEDALGTYRRKNGLNPASIEISILSIFGNNPSILCSLPVVRSFLLADVLFHELGHHHHRKMTHGIPDVEKEKYANQYRRKMLRRAFYFWCRLLRPFKPIFKLVLRFWA